MQDLPDPEVPEQFKGTEAPDPPVNQLGYSHFYAPDSGWFYGPYAVDPWSTDMTGLFWRQSLLENPMPPDETRLPPQTDPGALPITPGTSDRPDNFLQGHELIGPEVPGTMDILRNWKQPRGLDAPVEVQTDAQQAFQSWDDFPLVSFTQESPLGKTSLERAMELLNSGDQLPGTQQFWMETLTKNPMELDPSAYRKAAGKPPELVPGTRDVMPGAKRPRSNIDPTFNFLTDPQTLET